MPLVGNRASEGASNFLIPHISPTCSWRGALLFWVVRPRSGKVDFFSGTPARRCTSVLLSAAMEIRAWALKTLDGTARGCVRRSRDIPLEQLVGLESRFRRNGVLSRDESVAAILAAIAGVPNPDPAKFAAVTAVFRA